MDITVNKKKYEVYPIWGTFFADIYFENKIVASVIFAHNTKKEYRCYIKQLQLKGEL